MQLAYGIWNIFKIHAAYALTHRQKISPKVIFEPIDKDIALMYNDVSFITSIFILVIFVDSA